MRRILRSLLLPDQEFVERKFLEERARKVCFGCIIVRVCMGGPHIVANCISCENVAIVFGLALSDWATNIACRVDSGSQV